jgi:hypothetical protein
MELIIVELFYQTSLQKERQEEADKVAAAIAQANALKKQKMKGMMRTGGGVGGSKFFDASTMGSSTGLARSRGSRAAGLNAIKGSNTFNVKGSQNFAARVSQIQVGTNPSS